MQLFATSTPVPPSVWAVALAWLEPAIERSGEIDANGLMAMVNADEAQLWTAWASDVCQAALVTTRHGDTLHLWLCGGHGADWGNLLTRIMAFARADGVTRWTVDGRKGWQRVLKGVPNGDA